MKASPAGTGYRGDLSVVTARISGQTTDTLIRSRPRSESSCNARPTLPTVSSLLSRSTTRTIQTSLTDRDAVVLLTSPGALWVIRAGQHPLTAMDPRPQDGF